MKFRSRRTGTSSAVALIVLLAAIAAGFYAVQSLRAGRLDPAIQQVFGNLSGYQWSATPVLVAFIVIAVIGLMLLVAAITPGKPAILPVRSGQRSLKVGLTRRSVVRALRNEAMETDGVTNASASFSSNRVAVKAKALVKDEELAVDLRTVLDRRLNELQLERAPRLRVSLKEEG